MDYHLQSSSLDLSIMNVWHMEQPGETIITPTKLLSHVIHTERKYPTL